MKRYGLIALFPLFVVMTNTNAQETKEKPAEALIESKNFVFKAESVSPARGRLTQLISEYDLVVSGDSVTAFLPYFGRAFSAPLNPTDGGIKFSSGHAEYKSVQRKNDSWEIEIRPKDVQEVQTLYLTVFDNKRANLRVSSNNRESISFNGYIYEGRGGKKKAF
jgi:hypothetical protein